MAKRKIANIDVHQMNQYFQFMWGRVRDDEQKQAMDIPLMGIIAKDLRRRVFFSMARCCVQPEDAPEPWRPYLGPQARDEVCWIGALGGGSHEFPIYFAIILLPDCKTFGAFIPSDGNVWNTETRSAIGNNEVSDKRYLRRLWYRRDPKWIGDVKPEMLLNPKDSFMRCAEFLKPTGDRDENYKLMRAYWMTLE